MKFRPEDGGHFVTDRVPSPFDPDMVRSTAAPSPYASSLRSTHALNDQDPETSYPPAPTLPLLPAVPQYLPPPQSLGGGGGNQYSLPNISTTSGTQENGYADFGGSGLNFNPMLNNGISPIYPANGFDGFGFGAEETPEGLFDWGAFFLPSPCDVYLLMMRAFDRSMVVLLLQRTERSEWNASTSKLITSVSFFVSRYASVVRYAQICSRSSLSKVLSE